MIRNAWVAALLPRCVAELPRIGLLFAGGELEELALELAGACVELSTGNSSAGRSFFVWAA